MKGQGTQGAQELRVDYCCFVQHGQHEQPSIMTQPLSLTGVHIDEADMMAAFPEVAMLETLTQPQSRKCYILDVVKPPLTSRRGQSMDNVFKSCGSQVQPMVYSPEAGLGEQRATLRHTVHASPLSHSLARPMPCHLG
jgi:hypothetical protein